MRQDGKVAIVTGAATGIGQASAKALRQAGFRVFGTSRRAAASIADGITMIPCDVTDDASVKAVVDKVLDTAGRIDVLVNNAGTGLLAAAEESSVQQAQALFDVNLFGVIRTTNAVLPVMRSQKAGRIVNISSVMGLIPAPFSALYSSTKHALEGYSESLDHEVRTFGIRICLLEPAYTKTSFEQNMVLPDRSLDAYVSARTRSGALMREIMKTADSPDIVADWVLEAVTTKSPRLRYTCGKMARQVSVLRRFVPERMFDKSLRKQMGLPA
ncbi:oxidoreductase [Bradyrhizobium sp. ISRA443]|uniref:oxidoreductase n=1 Tax=unclassified Bradyrhizobium TaxID=2631580 RepID=UPI00247B0CAF|nr:MULTISPECIES: oxidoreductase [unclassified Bradyrhizobium]WGR94000.1 oxidoreductase [Bradyrhizobium sp. ISRA435]WGR98628.1 oxidoreductase [Bradyrhizobium sp. ISRA436]WGS05517.1 oxidoreductase [Bradyrhizobium sp. ISRA437]WGS12404.1 oxidoreductase [Bradyrhizobium sp. ISRA443]